MKQLYPLIGWAIPFFQCWGCTKRGGVIQLPLIRGKSLPSFGRLEKLWRVETAIPWHQNIHLDVEKMPGLWEWYGPNARRGWPQVWVIFGDLLKKYMYVVVTCLQCLVVDGLRPVGSCHFGSRPSSWSHHKRGAWRWWCTVTTLWSRGRGRPASLGHWVCCCASPFCVAAAVEGSLGGQRQGTGLTIGWHWLWSTIWSRCCQRGTAWCAGHSSLWLAGEGLVWPSHPTGIAPYAIPRRQGLPKLVWLGGG